MKQNKVYIFGKHAVEEALSSAPHALNKIYFDPKVADKELVKKIQASGVATAPLVEGMARADMKRGSSHQGVVAQILLSELMRPYSKFVEQLSVGKDTALVLLSGIEDPHNTGAIIRSAAAFGTHGVLMPERGQAPVTGAVIKVSAGMAFRIPLIAIEDVAQAVSDLKKRGFKVYALAGESKQSISETAFDAPAVFILGNEGEGVPKNIRALCDGVLCVPMHPRAESLNVAQAGAVALYEWSKRHPTAVGQ